MKKHLGVLLGVGAVLAAGGCVPDHWPQKWVAMSRKADVSSPAPPMPQWCYKTLARIDCYGAPQADMAHRLVSEPEARMLPQPPAKGTVEDQSHVIPVPLHEGK